jgi:hypothetical protein
MSALDPLTPPTLATPLGQNGRSFRRRLAALRRLGRRRRHAAKRRRTDKAVRWSTSKLAALEALDAARLAALEAARDVQSEYPGFRLEMGWFEGRSTLTLRGLDEIRDRQGLTTKALSQALFLFGLDGHERLTLECRLTVRGHAVEKERAAVAVGEGSAAEALDFVQEQLLRFCSLRAGGAGRPLPLRV